MTTPETAAIRPGSLVLAFAPVHKLALGVAFGTVFGGLIFLVTMVGVMVVPDGADFLALLAQYFYGYAVSPAGAAIGFFWGFVAGSVGGWFLAFARNVVVTMTIFALRTKAELSQTTDFLDHI
ncbi:MAG: hypothetical protein ABL993_02090 [Vicinamibacterales bacterium]